MSLKLLIAGTPKTGNTWLRFLLSGAYRLPMPDLPAGFSEEEMARLPGSWVAQQHYLPGETILSWADRERAVFLTTVRHPGDALVSLYHYVNAYENDPRWEGEPPGRMRGDREGPGEGVIAYVRDGFVEYLDQSLAWIRTGRPVVVRYEDLCRDPESTLETAIRGIHARRPDVGLPLDRVEGAVAACELGTLREGLGLDPNFFRKGGCGGWVDELPGEVVAMFRTMPPYPEMFRALGYSPDPAASERLAPRRGRAVPNPFAGEERLEDGISVPPFLVRLYLSLDRRTREGLRPRAGLSDPASYAAWLCAPAADDPDAGRQPLVTNLAAGLHAARADLQHAFPDPFGTDRLRFASWYLEYAGREHALDPAFFVAARASFLECAVPKG